jgi:hypothetical protein
MQQIATVSDTVFLVREGSAKAIVVRCILGLIFVSGGFVALLAHPRLHIIPCRVPGGILWEVKVASVGLVVLFMGLRELLLCRTILFDLTQRQIDFRYGPLIHLWVMHHSFDDFESIEVAVNARTYHRRAPYRVFLGHVLRGRTKIDECYGSEAAKALAASLSERTGLPVVASVWP